MWLLRRRRRFRVDGDSMQPTLEHGDFVFADVAHYRTHTPTVGELVVVQHPFESRILIKRISQVDGQEFSVSGDNPSQSSDSRSFGQLSVEALIGRVTSRIAVKDSLYKTIQ